MAAIAYPTMLRQPCLIAAKRSFTTSSKSSLPAINKPIARPTVREVINGTVNDAAPVPHSSPTHGSYHWTFERLISVGLVPLTVAPFAAGSLNPTTDALLCATLLIHSHIGFGAIITDYVPVKRLPRSKFVFDWGLKLATVVVGVGLYEFETNDVGVTEAIRRIWVA
ncbi:CybS-domain-containing protein [Bisporella sp. PMI_857]|nr:CybS-domain-containing protein [Bisporella sp. PMI_857]